MKSVERPTPGNDHLPILEARVVAATVSGLGFLSPPQTHGLEFAVGQRPPESFRRDCLEPLGRVRR